VLVVDDEPGSVEPAVELLRGHGCEVEQATDGSTGLERLAGALPDLLILDLLMPGINGFDVVDRLRADPRTERLPVLVYTSKDLTAEERARLSRQVQGITAKPAPDRLLAELKRVSAQAQPVK
jgi:CheY-like chemotaxis protein